MRHVNYSVIQFAQTGHQRIYPYITTHAQDDDTAGGPSDRKTMWISILTLVLSVPALIGA